MKLLECTDLRRLSIKLASRGELENTFAVDHMSAQVAKEGDATTGKDIAIESLFCDALGGLAEQQGEAENDKEDVQNQNSE